MGIYESITIKGIMKVKDTDGETIEKPIEIQASSLNFQGRLLAVYHNQNKKVKNYKPIPIYLEDMLYDITENIYRWITKQ